MGRSLADIKASAEAEKRPADEITPFPVILPDETIHLRDPDLITPAEEEDAPGGYTGLKLQIYLMCPDGEAFRKIWRELRHWDGDELLVLSNDIADHFRKQKSGKSRGRSKPSTGTPTK